MAHFRGTIENEKGKVSSIPAHRAIEVKANGWESGVRVFGTTGIDGVDKFKIYATTGISQATTGSFQGGKSTFLGTVKLDADGNVVFIPVPSA